MQITLTPEHEAQLSQLAARTGRSIDDVVHEALSLYLATKGEASLLFDEADALFGKRTGVKDGHDRYANQDDESDKNPDANRP